MATTNAASSDDMVIHLRQHAALISVALATARDHASRNVAHPRAVSPDREEVVMERSTMIDIHDVMLNAADALARLVDELRESTLDVVTLQHRFARHVQAHRAASPSESLVHAQGVGERVDVETQTDSRMVVARPPRSSLPPLRTSELQSGEDVAATTGNNTVINTGSAMPLLPLQAMLPSTQPMATPTPHRTEKRQAAVVVPAAPIKVDAGDDAAVRVITARGALGAITSRTMRAVRATRPCLPDTVDDNTSVTATMKSPRGEVRFRHVTAVPDAVNVHPPGMQRTYVSVRPLRSNDAMLQYDTHAISGGVSIDAAVTSIEGRLRAAAVARTRALQDDTTSAHDTSLDSGALDGSVTPQTVSAFPIIENDGVAALLAAADAVQPPRTPPPPYPRPANAVHSARMLPLEVDERAASL